MAVRLSFLVALAAILCHGAARATTITSHGVPVVAVGSDVQSVPTCPTREGRACYSSDGSFFGNGYQIAYYIPLSKSNGGIYGVTPRSGGTAGTFSDTGSGAANTLRMILRFSAVAPQPLETARLDVVFDDLDLDPENDPNGFFESVQFFEGSGGSLSDLITSTSTPPSGFDYTISSSGKNAPIHLTFTDLTSVVTGDAFYLQLVFGSRSSSSGRNTPEYLTATLNTSTAAHAPEPGTMGLLGLGAAALSLRRRRRSRNPSP